MNTQSPSLPAEPLAVSELPKLMGQAGTREVPIMVFVGNRHCI